MLTHTLTSTVRSITHIKEIKTIGIVPTKAYKKQTK